MDEDLNLQNIEPAGAAGYTPQPAQGTQQMPK